MVVLLGLTVIGTVSSEAKAAVALAHGCDHIINYSHEDVAKRGDLLARPVPALVATGVALCEAVLVLGCELHAAANMSSATRATKVILCVIGIDDEWTRRLASPPIQPL